MTCRMRLVNRSTNNLHEPLCPARRSLRSFRSISVSGTAGTQSEKFISRNIHFSSLLRLCHSDTPAATAVRCPEATFRKIGSGWETQEEWLVDRFEEHVNLCERLSGCTAPSGPVSLDFGRRTFAHRIVLTEQQSCETPMPGIE
jgi:hypothetical protein